MTTSLLIAPPQRVAAPAAQWDAAGTDDFFDEPETNGESLTAEEKMRPSEPDHRMCCPAADQADPVHERFSDGALRLLAPVLRLKTPPLPEQLDQLMKNHPMRSARPGGATHALALEYVGRYFSLKGWN